MVPRVLILRALILLMYREYPIARRRKFLRFVLDITIRQRRMNVDYIALLKSNETFGSAAISLVRDLHKSVPGGITCVLKICVVFKCEC